MRYEIQRKSDLQTGATLVVKIPEDELDIKAMYTIQADSPGFILPFRYRSVDGNIEFVYQIGLHNKLEHLAGARRQKEYAELWLSLVSPLLECSDWFMKPYSFVLSAEFLYYNRNKKTINYVYVPTIRDSSDYRDLKEMAAEVSKMITAADPDMENKVLRAIMKDFDLKGFLQMLKGYTEEAPPAPLPSAAPLGLGQAPPAFAQSAFAPPACSPPGFAPPALTSPTLASPAYAPPTHAPPAARVPDYIAKGAAGKAPQDYCDDTQSILIPQSEARLRYCGCARLPAVIDVQIELGGIFSIGRYDVATCRPQSSFEFDKKTKAISRRHAVIERDQDGYTIVDLASSAGTFLNGQKLPPNTPCKLDHGSRVSFGNAGADYVWEQ